MLFYTYPTGFLDDYEDDGIDDNKTLKPEYLFEYKGNPKAESDSSTKSKSSWFECFCTDSQLTVWLRATADEEQKAWADWVDRIRWEKIKRRSKTKWVSYTKQETFESGNHAQPCSLPQFHTLDSMSGAMNNQARPVTQPKRTSTMPQPFLGEPPRAETLIA